MIVVSNSSPLITLSRIGRLDIVASFFDRIIVPFEVHREVTVDGRGLPGAEEVQNAVWIEVARQEPLADPQLEQACRGLGDGERAVILLAKSLPAGLVLLDEKKARRIAQAAGLAIMGCLGVLEAGYRRGLVPDLREAYLEMLRQEIRFDIGLLQDSLARLGLPKL